MKLEYSINVFQITLKRYFHIPSSQNNRDNNGYLLNCMHKQQDFFGCLAKILGCLSHEKALGQPKIKARPPKRSRCICIQCNRRFCCIFGQRLKPFQHQSFHSSVGRACGSHATALGSIPSDFFAF